jgi:hypothetical protein
MSAMNVDQVWEAVRNFTPEQLQRLRTFLDALLENPALLRKKAEELTPEDKVTLALLKDGLLSKIPRPPTEEDIKRFREFKPVEIEGEPLSETIVRERR